MHDGAILSWEQGLGKTLAAFAWPIIKGARRVLLVVPEGLHLQFQDTARDFFGTFITILENRDQIHAFGLNLPPAPNTRTQFFMTTYQDLGQNGADEWPDEVEKDGTVNYNQVIVNARMANPLVRRLVEFEQADDALRGAPKRSAFDVAKAHFHGIGDSENGITCVMVPTLARVLRMWDCFDCVVVDEGTRLQANDSHIGMGVRMLNPTFRLVLTGTPIKNRLESLFWLAWWACGGSMEPTARWPYNGTSEAREEFANQHLQHDRFITQEKEKEQLYKRRYKIEKRTARVTNIHRLWKLLAPVIVRRRKDECGEDIVPKIIKPIRIRPGTQQQKVYGFHLTNRPVAAKSGKEVNRRTAIGMQLNILRQAALTPDEPNLASVIYEPGAGKLDERRSRTVWTPRLAAIMSVIADQLNAGKQVIVGSPFIHFSNVLHSYLKHANVSTVLLDGATSPAIRAERAAAFKAKQYSVMVAGIKAMGEGHSFECCSRLILPSLSWAYDENEQFVHRVWRINSPEDVEIYTMVMENSIDEKLLELFQEKGDSAQLALDGKLFADKVEEIDLSALLAGAVRSFNPNAPTIDEADISSQWDEFLRLRVERAELRFREWHPPIIATKPTVTRRDMVQAVAATRDPRRAPQAIFDFMDPDVKIPSWQQMVKQIDRKK